MRLYRETATIQWELLVCEAFRYLVLSCHMNAVEFIAKWKHAELKERSAAQEHFIDLCRLLGHPTPAEADPTGASFCFEKGGEKLGGGNGFADVWKKGFFGWEYKGAGKDLRSAYCQLLTYVKAIDNPPLLVVSDIESIIVHTNFTNAPTVTHTIPLDRMADPASLTVLHALFFDPEKLRPEITRDAITRDAAVRFAEVARSMRERGLDPVAVAHFLNRIVFCLFAEDTGLLPQGLFTRIVASAGNDLARLAKLLRQLFDAMAKGGDFGTERIRYFNGSLFDSDDVLELTHSELRSIASAASLDWEEIDPTIFGTLFERGLDPATRAQLGAHFTGREDIESVVDAVVMPPLRRDWAETRQTVCNLLTYGKKSGVGSRLSEVGGRKSPESHCPISDSRPPTPDSRSSVSGSRLRKIRLEAESLTQAFLTRLQGVKVLDPACGSGNFLYVTLLRLKDLEKDVMIFSVENGLSPFLTLIGPWQLYGIELNPFAYDLAQMTVWIGWLQWRIRNGLNAPDEPVLKKLAGNFRNGDAILRRATDGQGAGEPEWPAVDFIVGNPPFLGDKMMRRELGDAYVNELRSLYEGRIPGQSDLCCYWFEKARAHIESGKCKRAGLLATQGIRGGANREVLNRIKKTGDIFWAVSDKDWVLDGANVHISIVAFDDGKEETKTLDRQSVKSINPNLSAGANTAGGRASQVERRNMLYRNHQKGTPGH